MLAGPLYSAVARPLCVAAELFPGSRPVNSGYCPELNRSAFNHTTPRSVACNSRQPEGGRPET